MQFCLDHWNLLKQRIDDRGLTHLIAKDGHVAAEQAATQIQEAGVTAQTFDPLMSAQWAISGNVMDFLHRSGMNPLYLMSGGEEDKCDGTYGPQYEGRPWPRCPLCYINFAHEVSCKDLECTLDKVRGYDWMLDRAADDALKQARELKVVGPAS